MSYFAALNPMNLVNALPGCIAQGVIWGIMALGVYVTFRLLDFADLTVDGSFATGGAVTVMLTLAGVPIPAALLVAIFAVFWRVWLPDCCILLSAFRRFFREF